VPIEFRHDGPWELPAGWVWARLGDIGRWTGGGTPSKSNSAFWSEGTIPWISPKDMKQDRVGNGPDRITRQAVEKSAAKLIPQGSVLMVVRSGILSHTFPVAVSDREVTINQDMRALVPHQGINARYISLALKRLERKILQECSKDGTTVASVDPSQLEDVLVPIAPAVEQRRIAARIDELFAEIADGETALVKAREELDAWRRALLKAATTGELTREWREQQTPNETGAGTIARWRRKASLATGELDFRAKPISEGLPETWAWTTIGDAGEIRLGRQRAPQHHNGEDMRPYLRVANVFEGRLDLSDVKSMNFSPDEFEIYRLKTGDVLLNEGQSPELLGRPAMYRGEIEDCCFQNTLLRFRANEGLAPEFALLVFRHYLRSGRFKQEGRITTNLAHLSQTRCAAIEFPVPPAAEQAHIVSHVRALEERASEQLEGIEISAIGHLRQSVLKTAFEGSLVEHDPSDEPADAFLSQRLSLAAE
jgi:type I restriction enzyme, S subunit